MSRAAESGPMISVGLPVYNGERYLAEAIESILGQDHLDLELIIADNGSTDRTPEISAKYAELDGRVKVHRSPTNRGAAWNYNRTVDFAAGRYFKWASHDDVLEPAFLSRCAAVLEARPDVVLCFPRAVEIDSDGNTLFEHAPIAYDDTCGHRRVRSILGKQTPCLEAFGLMRRDALLRTRRIGAYTSSDRVLFIELALQGRFHEVPESLFRHRRHDQQSVRAIPDARMRNAWFDPDLAGRRSSPTWRLLKEYGRALLRGVARPRDRLGSTWWVLGWAWRRRSALVHEAASATLSTVGRMGSGLLASKQRD